MDFPQRAVFFLEEDSSVPEHSKPLMLEAILHRPIMERAADAGSRVILPDPKMDE